MTNQERLQANNEEIAEIKQILSTKAGGVGGVEVIDNLKSTSTTSALSANQGRLVNERVTDLSNAISQALGNLSSTDVTLLNQINTKADNASIDNLQTQITENKQSANDGLTTLTKNVTDAVNAINTNVANADAILQQQIASNDDDIADLQDRVLSLEDMSSETSSSPVETFEFTITSHEDNVIAEGDWGYDFGFRNKTSIKMTAPDNYTMEKRPCYLSFDIWYNIGMNTKWFTSPVFLFEDASNINFNTSTTNQGGCAVAQISLAYNAYAGYWCDVTCTYDLESFNFNKIVVKRKYLD